MENVEHSRVASTTPSLPKTTQNDCYDDDEHVINQNQQTPEISNTNSNVLDLTESSSATINETYDSCTQQQVELVKHLGPESEDVPQEKLSIDEQQAPVDLTSVNATQIKSSNLEYQTEPFNLKMDALASIHPTSENVNIENADNTLVVTQNSSDVLDLHKSSENIFAPESTEAPAQLEDVLENQAGTAKEVTINVNKTNETVPAQHESVLDLRINNVNEVSKSPRTSEQVNQARLSQIKVENTLESRVDPFFEKAEQSAALIKSPPKLNGSHRYSPNETCETALGSINFAEKIATSTEVPDIVKNMEQSQNDFNTFSPTIMENRQQYAANDSFSNSFENLPEQGSEDFEQTNNAGSANEQHDSRYSSSDSLNSASTLRSSSSHQLIIDQPTEDDKVVPPLRLKLKRKHRKSTSSTESTQPSKRANVETISNTENLSIVNVNEAPKELNPTLPTTIESLTTDVHSKELEHLANTGANDVQNSVVLPQFHEAPSQPTPTTETLQADDVCENRLLCNQLEENFNDFKPPTAAQYYKCTTCGTFHENWSFFLHLQEKHDRFLCLYCIKCFPTAEKLALHLEIKHDLEQNHFNTEEAFRNSALIIHGFNLETRFLMCCTCQYIFRENAAFTEHACIEFMKSCLMCGQKGRHTNQCKANPLAKRRSKKKTRQKPKPPSIDFTPLIEPIPKAPSPTLPPPLPPQQQQQPVLAEQEALMEQPQQQITQKTPVRRQSDDSNSSSNMVIDESCNTNHNLLPNQINPFKALDDTERMEQEEEEEAARWQAAQVEKTNSEHLANNNVFKLKLRVPKEFQKPVDEEISTSESEHGEIFEDDTAADINSNQVEFKNNKLEQETSMATTATPPPSAPSLDAEQHVTNNEKSLPQSEEESNDDTVANAHLARILQEIEQTKLDIEKTKETLHQRHSKSESTASKPAVDVESNAVVETPATTAATEEHWTPTPPASPNSNAKSNDVVLSELNLNAAVETAQPMTESDMNIAQENSLTTENLPLNEPVDDTMKSEENVSPAPPPDDGIEVANEDCLVVELQLDRPLDQFETVEFVRICLKAAYPYCLYCNHARRIAVNAESLVLHLIAQHRFMATVDSITAEELQPSTLVAKLKSFLPELQDQFMNSSSYCTIGEGRFTRHFNERIFECFQCRFVTSTHKELYLHNRKMHLRTAILCFMCRCNFYSFSEILCHICPGVPHRVSIFEIKFRCCLCDLTEIPSPFRLMVHLRKRHFACDVCLEDCRDQSKLSSHVWKHKLHHLCYRCGIAYRNKLDITKHLFWKHGTESAMCKRCLQKRWPHVYHFCVPPAIFSCDVCQLCFSKAMYLTVHKRLHQNDFRYACTEAGCQEKFISRKLLLKHSIVHETAEIIKDENVAEAGEREQQKHEEADEKEQQEQKPILDNEAGTETAADDVAKVKSETESIKDEEALNKKATDNTPTDVVATPTQQQPQSPNATPKTTTTEQTASTDQPSSEKKHKKRKKRAKESLEDLNLTAPNLSESGSSSESESETKSTIATSKQELALSPLSEHGEQKASEQLSGEPSAAEKNDGNVLDIWKNFLQAQQQAGELQQYAEYTEDDYPTPKCLHVCISDHDYCAMFPQIQATQEVITSPNAKHESTSNLARNFSSSSEASSGDSSSSSSCSCGSNCSCSNGSSSSSSSGDSSDSSVSATKKRLRKKSERSNRHRKSFSSSPLKPQHAQHNTSGDNVNVIDTDDNANAVTQLQEEAAAAAKAEEAKTNLEPTINESDLETAESDTDEEYYDEHPQKLATELLSQKRAQLMARTLLSPSHNFDIVENSRPSTPSLPEDVMYEKRQKKKKTKRERKSTSNNKMLAATSAANELHEYLAAATAAQHNSTMEAAPMEPQYNQSQASSNAYMPPQNLEAAQSRQMMPTTPANHYVPRISEGSSCSDADNSLKRSKRQRRPNKFYGYTSDDESMAPAAMGQSLVIGMRAYKPLPPPQLVWDKEDLPTPDKSILNVNKKTSRQSSAPNSLNASLGGGIETSTKKKKASAHRKRTTKHASDKQKLPPIPRLKIRSAFLNKSIEASDLGLDYSSDSASSDVEQPSGPPPRKRTFPPKHSSSGSTSSTFLRRYPPNQQPPLQQQQTTIAAAVVPPPLPLPPTPQTTAFNHKIPPALLPNPDFSTLQYFKANNIRYPIRPPAGARAAREGESVYCYCRCPYDEVSEMIACDGDSCLIEWFHFECVGIMLAPQGKWFCAECRPQYSEELYPTTAASTSTATNFT